MREEDGLFRSGLSEGRYSHDEGKATGSETRGCAHVDRGWREANWTDERSMADELGPLKPEEHWGAYDSTP